MLYELRVYEPNDGKGEALLERFREHTLRLFATHGIEVLGLFNQPDRPGNLAYLTRFADELARKEAWAAFAADGEWQRVKADTERDGPLLRQQSVTTMPALPAGLSLG